MRTLNLSKTERIDIRASTPVKQLLQEAARACHKNVSKFLLDAGVTAAVQTLTERRQLILDGRSGRHSRKRWTGRCKASRA